MRRRARAATLTNTAAQEEDMKTARPLTSSQRQELEAELRTERARLERSIAAQTAAGQQALGAGEFEYDASSGGLHVGLETRTSVRLEAILAALARIEAGTYGTCASCRNPIPYGRLIVMPESTLCLACRA
jgi:DnaK suppressor protein